MLIARARACSPGRLCRRRATPRSSGELTTVSTLSARPSFRYCFTLEWRQNALMVTPLLLRPMAVLNVPPAGSLGLRPRGERLNKISTCSGRPRSRLSATSASKNARAWRGHQAPGSGRPRPAASTAPTSSRQPGQRESGAAAGVTSTGRRTPGCPAARAGRRSAGGRRGHRRRRTRSAAQ